MSEPSPSTETAVDTGLCTGNPDQPDQPLAGPSGPVRSPGTRTPRRVQWAAAVDEDEDDGDHRGLDVVDEDDSDHHELDQAGLDVCGFVPFVNKCLLTAFILHSLLPSERSLMPSNVIIAQILPRHF
jgi:hypothetical protein